MIIFFARHKLKFYIWKDLKIYLYTHDVKTYIQGKIWDVQGAHLYMYIFFFGSHSSFVLSYRVLRESLDFLRTELRLFLFRWLKWYARRKLAGNKRPLKVVQKNITWGCGHCFILEDVWSYFHPMDCRRLILRRFLYWINTLEILFV